MNIDIIHDGQALQFEGRILRLKDLLPLKKLTSAPLFIARANFDGRRLTLTMKTGEVFTCDMDDQFADSHGKADLVIHNARQILTFEDTGVGLQESGSIACLKGKILDISKHGFGSSAFPTDDHTLFLDAQGGIVTPGLIDPHTHPVFAGQRAVEFGMKAEGKSYLEIHKAGGGILSTVKATREASSEELLHNCHKNLNRLLSWGVTTCEAKSGYALDTDGEIRLLEVLRRANGCHPLDIEPTFLGAHAIPPKYKNNRADYVSEIMNGMLPRIAAQQLARYCDAYCEDGAFTSEETEQIFSAAQRYGLGLRLHAEQFTDQGGAKLAASLGAASVDHLEAISDEGIAALAQSSTVAILLPGAALACRAPWPPARKMLDAGVSVALGTDLNPGSSMTASLPLMMSLACMQMRMSCEESWRAVTVNAATSLGRADVGKIAPGYLADFVIFDAPDYRYVPYHYGENHARVIIKRGQVVVGEANL